MTILLKRLLKDLLKSLLKVPHTLLAIALIGCNLASLAGAQRKPNIILFVVDDMGWQDTSVEFHSHQTVWNTLYNTPNMQRLANSGMKFTNAYSASPVCSPTRVSMLTGKNPARSRVTDWVRQTGERGNANTYLRSPNDWRMQGKQPGDGLLTLPTILKANGYRTAHVGKAHFGSRDAEGGNHPTNLGFDINIGGSEIGSPVSYFSPWSKKPNLYPNLERHAEGAYINDVLTIEANQIIHQAVADDMPFFINMAHYAVHTRIRGQGAPNFLPAYQKANRPDPEDDYAAILESMDARLGSLLDNLAAEGIEDNTLVIFISDNGGLSNHARNLSGVQTVQTLDGKNVSVNFQKDHHNSPLRSGKGTAYEGGIRVPMIVSWAGQKPEQLPINTRLPIAAGSTSHKPVISDDIFTTLLHVASVANVNQYLKDDEGHRTIDGVDLTPILDGSGTFQRSRPMVIHYPHQWYKNIGIGEGVEPFSAIRSGDYKLIYFYGDGKPDGVGLDPRLELYNLADDLGEQNALSHDENALLLQRLTNDLASYLRKVEAPLPIVKATGLPAELPAISPQSGQ